MPWTSAACPVRLPAACCVSYQAIGKQIQFFGARANLAKALLLAINGGRCENTGTVMVKGIPVLTGETLKFAQTACDQEKTIEIQYSTSIPELNDGIVSQFKRFSKAITALKYRDAGIVLTPAMGATEATSIALTYSPERFNELIETFKRNYSQMPEMLKEQKLNEANSQWFMKAIGWKK